MKGLLLAACLLVLSSTPVYAITDAELIEKYVVPAYRTPEEPKQCRGMVKAFEFWSDSAEEVRALERKSAANARELLTKVRAHAKKTEKHLKEIDRYIQKHCQSWEQTPYAVEMCKWSIPVLCDFSHVGKTEAEVCTGAASARSATLRVIASVGRIATLRDLTYGVANGSSAEHRAKTYRKLTDFYEKRTVHRNHYKLKVGGKNAEPLSWADRFRTGFQHIGASRGCHTRNYSPVSYAMAR